MMLMDGQSNNGAILAIGALVSLIGIYAVRAYPCGEKNREPVVDSFASHVCEHDGAGLVELSEGTLWHVTVQFKGYGPPWRRMIVFRPPKTSKLILISPSAVTEDVMSKIEELGEVGVLVIPNSYHRADAAVFKSRYPDAKVACPPAWVRKAVSEVVPVDMDARELSKIYPESIKVIRIGGQCDPKEEEGDYEYAFELRCKDGSWAYSVTDGLFNFTEKNFMNWLLGCTGIEQANGCCTPRMGRISKFLVHSKEECARFYRQMSERKDVSMILMAHGDVYVGDTTKPFQDIANDIFPETS
eukprot:scaffold6572_cov106-Cylindrotheca_fusiformis.AAC.1